MSNALHHLHKRKRIHSKKEQYPHPDKLRKFVDQLVYIVGVFVPAMTFLQLYKIYSEKNADGVSTVAFSGYILANFVWLLYGYLHNEKPIILMYILLAFFNVFIVLGTILY